MYKHIASVAGVALSVLFVVVFFVGRGETRHLTEIAPRVGMSPDDLLAMAPRIASQTGATLGTSRRVVYLLACSGLPTRHTLEEQATQAGALAKQERLSDREAVSAVLTRSSNGAGTGRLDDC
jgi:protein-disulfide isomerase-like protein with CxxC motif